MDQHSFHLEPPTPKNDQAGSNVPEFSVSELAGSIKKTIETTFGRVRVRGEIGRVTTAASGHIYTNIKDDKATIDAVCWRGQANQLSIRPEEGMDVICIGKLTTYPNSSKYQLIIESLELAGEGAILKMLAERKKKLEAEGLFNPARKKPIPFLPKTIGVVTSPTGAVIRDIIHRIEDRFPRNIILYPAVVQGENAAEQIVKGIEFFNNAPNKPDILIVGRGGGSLEDLMPFNEEAVVRAVANSQIPIISAVGHETDTTLIDFAADLRAPTPTGAAEMAVPVRANLIAQIHDNEQRLINAGIRIITERKTRLQSSSRGLGNPAQLLENKTQALDMAHGKLISASQIALSRKQQILAKIQIQHPSAILKNAQIRFTRWQETLDNTKVIYLKNKTQNLENMTSILKAYSHENILSRGYALVRGEDGTLIKSSAQARKAVNLEIQFGKDDKQRAQTV